MTQQNAHYRLNRVDTRLLYAKQLVQEAASGRLGVNDGEYAYESYLKEFKAMPAGSVGSRKAQISKFTQFIKLGRKRPSDAVSILEEVFDMTRQLHEVSSLKKGGAFDNVLAAIRAQLNRPRRLTNAEFENILRQ